MIIFAHKSSKHSAIMNTIIGIIAFVVVALVGWAIAELKGKTMGYNHDELEKEVLNQQRQALEKNGFSELNIKDVIRTISTTGYSAV